MKLSDWDQSNKVSERKKKIDQLNNALEASNSNTLLIPRKVVRDRVLTASFHRLSRKTLWRRRKETIKGISLCPHACAQIPKSSYGF